MYGGPRGANHRGIPVVHPWLMQATASAHLRTAAVGSFFMDGKRERHIEGTQRPTTARPNHVTRQQWQKTGVMIQKKKKTE